MRKKLKNEKGSATIEFLAMVPLVLFIMMVLWQFLVAGYAVIIAQSALNEAAKTYAVADGNRLLEANAAANDFINDAGGNLNFNGVTASTSGQNFTLTLNASLRLEFIPENIVGSLPAVPFTKTVHGRVIE